jgi:hypothetical protein
MINYLSTPASSSSLPSSDDHMTCFINININIDTSIPMPPNVGHRGGCPSLWLLDARIPQIGYGVTANIAASHAAARGSIPRIRITFFLFSLPSAILMDPSPQLRQFVHCGTVLRKSALSTKKGLSLCVGPYGNPRIQRIRSCAHLR